MKRRLAGLFALFAVCVYALAATVYAQQATRYAVLMMGKPAGVTTVRDMVNDIDALAALRNKIASNEEIGPRIIMAGLMDGRGPYAGPTKVLVDTEEEARAAVDNYARLG